MHQSTVLHRQVRRRLLHAHNQLLGATHSSLSEMLSFVERWSASAAACGRSVEILEAAYPPGSLVVALQEMKHASLIRQSGDHVTSERLMDKAARVLMLHYGDPGYGLDDPGWPIIT